MLDLYDFQAEVRNRGTLSANKFDVRIDPPASMMTAEQGRQLALRAVTAAFPGRHLMTKDDIVRYGYGPVDKTPYNALYSDMPISFLLDTNGDVYKFFDDWHKSIIDADSSDTMFDTGKVVASPEGAQNGQYIDEFGAGLNGTNPYEVEYKDDYCADITVTKRTDLHNKSLSCLLYKAFPVTISEIALDAAAQSTISLVTITFSYRDHKIIHHNDFRDRGLFG